MVGLLSRDQRVWAVLGPTNTGKTHLAIERMLGHPTGMIGLPLRLLAREVYDRIVKARGVHAVALHTGEEKIAPDSARYVVATVEAMPPARGMSFVAIDEIQLCADPDRGHIFTERLLHMRGEAETMFLGSDTMRPLIRQLVPGVEIEARERFSKLSYVGPTKITKLPRRTAIVAFSAEEVYAIAELIRRHRGGAAVVMGALSPRTRNAQVQLYQSGEVDFLVATDAIGMGLNMDVDRVAFAALSKFDGRRMRRLSAAEVAQIAGRAGRFRTDGVFGETGDCPEMDAELVGRVEDHRFEPVEKLEWRSADLAFDSIAALEASLDAPSPAPELVRSRGASDEETLRRLAHHGPVRAMVKGRRDVRRLWELCQLPDFRKVTIDEHARLVEGLFVEMAASGGAIRDGWVAARIDSLDRTDGDLDALQARLAHIRTWTYAANRADWLENPAAWRERTRAIEDRLSDTLHERLTQRFIDRRTSALLKGLRREEAILAGIAADGQVTVEGHHVGRISGLRFHVDPQAVGLEERALRNAAIRALRPELARRLGALAKAGDPEIALEDDGRLFWNGDMVGGLAPCSDPLSPRVRMLADEAAPVEGVKRAQARLEAWLAARVARDLKPLVALDAALKGQDLRGLARGVAWRLRQGFGAVDRAQVADDVASLSGADRQALRALGVRFGRWTVFLPALLKPGAARLAALLRFHAGDGGAGGLAPLLPRAGATSIPARPGFGPDDHAAAGYRLAGPRAIRFDALEGFAEALSAARAAQGAQFALPQGLASLIGCPAGELEAVLRALGLAKARAGADGAPDLWRLPAPAKRAARAAPVVTVDPASPFAKLAALAAPAPPRRTRKPRPRRRKTAVPAA